jgi:hypothetical protein
MVFFVGILPHHCTRSQLRRSRIFTAVETSNLAFRILISNFVTMKPQRTENEGDESKVVRANLHLRESK